MRRFIHQHTAAVTFLVTFLCASLVFAAQAQPAPVPTPADMTWLRSALQIAGAVSILLTAVGHFVMLLAVKWPSFGNFAHMLVAGGYDFGKIVKSGSAMVGSDPPAPPPPPPPPPALGAGVVSSAMGMILLVIALGLTSVGCAGLASVFQNVTSNPVVAASAFEEALQVAGEIAQGTWAIVYPLIPGPAQPQALAQYSRAQDLLTDAESAIDAAKTAYAAGTAQDWTTVYANATKAFDDVVAIIDLYTTSAPAAVATTGLIVPKSDLAKTNFAASRARLATAGANVHWYH